MTMDFGITKARGHLIRMAERAKRNKRTEFTAQEFDDNFDELFARVEKGETLTVDHNGKKVLFMPLDKYNECLTGSTPKNDSD